MPNSKEDLTGIYSFIHALVFTSFQLDIVRDERSCGSYSSKTNPFHFHREV